MYIVELMYKSIINLVRKNPLKAEDESIEPECEHVFLPIDSTKKILACTKCGEVIKADDLKKTRKNFFMNKTE